MLMLLLTFYSRVSTQNLRLILFVFQMLRSCLIKCHHLYSEGGFSTQNCHLLPLELFTDSRFEYSISLGLRHNINSADAKLFKYLVGSIVVEAGLLSGFAGTHFPCGTQREVNTIFSFNSDFDPHEARTPKFEA